MRQCFAYCSLYPKDWTISKDELIQLWMAQGYLICSIEKQHMEDVGNQFVKMFLMNSFFQDADIDKYGEIKSFKMHDLMHDLAMLVAGNDCCYLDRKAEKVEGSPMHISFESDEAIHLLNENRVCRLLRTLILPYYIEEEEYLSVIAKFKYLRVLKMGPFCCFDLSRIKSLKHLRYLALKQETSLPKVMSNLVFLQTLKLKKCDQESFSDVVTKFVNLRFLEVDDYDSLSKVAVGWGKLSSLQFLPIFVVRDSQETKGGTLNELKDLNLRGNLEIKGLYRVREVALESREVNLKEKKFLQSLTLDWKDLGWKSNATNRDSLQLLENLQPHHNLKHLSVCYYSGELFPNWLSLITNVIHISLCILPNCRCLPPLERLPSLKSLTIIGFDELEYIYHYEDDFAVTFFPSLESLTLSNCPKLKGWRRRGDDINDSKNSHNLSLPLSFLHLSRLQVSLCPQLTGMPIFPNVTDLDMWECSVEPLIATLNTTGSTCSADSSAAPLSKLELLTISNVNIKALTKGWMQNLTSLESLRIELGKSERLEEFETEFKDDTNCLPFLRNISISWCETLEALPGWICNLSSLEEITISYCSKLALLPEGMSRLRNLKIFVVEN